MDFDTYQNVQRIAKEAHSQPGQFINSESTELTIAQHATDLLSELGAPETLHHNVPAFVLLGKKVVYRFLAKTTSHPLRGLVILTYLQ